MSKDERKYRVIGIVLAIAFHAGVVAFMVFTHLTSSEAEDSQRLAQMEKTEIAFGGEEYVQFGDIPEPGHDDGEAADAAAADEPAEAGSDDDNSGVSGDGEALVTNRNSSSAAVVEKKKQNGPSEADLRRQEEQARIKREREEQQKEKNKISSRTSSAFNRTGGGGSGTSGSPEGNATSGALSGAPGHDLGEHYRLSAQSYSCKKSGTLRISIVVRRDGTITQAKYAGGSGEAAADASIRRMFEDRTKRLRFTITGEVPAEKRGVITWVIK